MILAAGLSPAWQQIMEFDAVHAGRVNRASQVTWCASGKVLNVGRALQTLGAPARTLCLVGGLPGDAIRREFADAGIDAHWIDAGVPTRVCTTLLDRATGTTTELVENAAACDASAFDEFARAFADETAAANTVIVTGSLPPNAPDGFVRRLLMASQKRALLDIRGAELLQVLDLAPLVVKPNRQELSETLKRELVDDRALLAGMREINRRGAEWVVVSDGGRALRATSTDLALRIVPPQVTVVNPIGCGDCLTAGMAEALERGESFADAIQWGVAVAAANAERLLPADFDVGRARDLQEAVVLQEA